MESTLRLNIKRSRRNTIGLRINDDGSVTVFAPLRAGKADIDRAVKSKIDWIMKNREKILRENRVAEEKGFLSENDIRKLRSMAEEIIPRRVEFYAQKVGVTYGRITIRSQKTRWGSCSAKGNLNFNCLLMLMPTEVLDSVVVHELCHRKEMNHSQRFYAEVLKVFPEYRKWDLWLKENGGAIMKRMTG